MAQGKDADDQLTDEALETAAPTGKKKKLLFMIIAIAGIVVLVGGGGAVWLLMTPGDEKEHKEVAQEEGAPIYEKLETFTVNLADKESYLQVEISLKLSDPETQTKLKLYMPEVRDVLLRLLSSKTADELTTQEGKDKLSGEVLTQVNGLLHIQERGKGVKGVLFHSFIIQ